MKVTQIFGLVLLFHLVAISLILLQPGCQTRQPPPPPDDPLSAVTGAAPGDSALSGTPAPDYGSDYTPPPDRQAPTRPEGSRPTTAPASNVGTLDPAFNAGLTGDSATGVLQPLLVPSVDLDSDGMTASPRPATTTYTVESGDNLTRIARDFGVTVDAIMTANGLSSSVIRVGQELQIPAPTATVQNTGRDSAGSATYTVRPGDSLSVIASRHGTSVAELKAANDLSSDRILVGQELYLPRGSSPAGSANASSGQAAPAEGGGNTYTVKAGDTPGGIAKRFGVDYRDLMRVNNIASANRMRIGQRLIIPAGGTQPSAAAEQPANQPSPEQPAELRPQPSQPVEIDNEPPAVPEDPMSQLDLLESSDLPLMEVEVIGEDDNAEGNNTQ